MDPQVLIIEDDLDIASILVLHLEENGYDVSHFANGREGLEAAKNRQVDLLILDVMLPGMNGLDICKEVRRTKPVVPILMLTSLDTETDRVVGLELGADDYVAKPFGVRELLARVKALFRRNQLINSMASQKRVLESGGLRMNPGTREAFLNNKPMVLTNKEFDLLYLMASHEGQAFSRDELLTKIWGAAHSGYEHTVNTHINRIRNKIADVAKGREYIQTVWGIGYKFHA